ncbi:Serine aminopeptidase, S33 [Roseomonas rosea]|uniref:Serine aminopeptidase, S33 n=1 Tax=Muricoccus roseus TaxID=198092 RepID=A0A1M6MJP2_9PROT|nr:Serine aminopeptidase, S33 [Roseomonas rosea]
MLSSFRPLLAVLCLMGFTLAPAAGRAQDGPVQVSSGLQYELLQRWDVDKLNHILQVDTPAFAGIPVTYTAARSAVKLYRVTYSSVIPEQNNRPIVATGLVAVPETQGTAFPVVSYQHGTVYGRQEVPSFPDQSPETALMIAQFAGQGYVVIGADYFGMGTSQEPEGYMVKGSHQQATADMIAASRAVLAHLGLNGTKLFLAGWSQGGFVTMALLERLEGAGVPVAAAATASAPLDVFATLNGFLSFPRPNDASWVSTLFILSSFSFENYYQVPGLARSLLSDEYYDLARRAYERQPINPQDVPTDLRKLIRAPYFDAQFFAASAYGRLVASAQAYRWIIRSPVRNYYGESDEAITAGIGRLAMTYQQAIGSGNTAVQAVSTGPTSHRGTFAQAVPSWKEWFDGLSRP